MERVQHQDRGIQGWSFVQIFVTAMVALLVARYSLRFYQTSEIFTSDTSKSRYYPNMKFNSSTLYPTLYISDDEKTITNRPTDYTKRVSSGPSHLHRYTGVLLNNHLSLFKKMYIEVKISFRTVSQAGSGILFEIGFEEKEEIDKLLFLRDYFGTIYVRVATCNNENYVCLSASDGKLTYPKYKLSKISGDDWYDLRLGFHIYPDDDVIKVVYSLDNNKRPVDEIYKFLNADINDNKWPVFALYNPHMFQVHMKLNSAKNILFDSATIHPMIYISENDLEISNIPTKTTFRRSYRVGQLQNYEGVVGNISFDTEEAKFQNWPDKVYFDIKIEYNVTLFISRNYLFEIGMSRYKYIDKYWSVGPQRYALSVYGSACNAYKEICLFSLKDSVHTIIDILSSSKVGTHFQGIVTFSVDFSHKTVSVSKGSKIFVFNNVDMTEPLWPVFAMYKHSVDTLMTLNVNK